ncbi:hypothetical protein H5410_026410 [Solanum commersonii]|uniref:Uncharacterized protein n=1 Tax=Solanum commersonii TaxID=4109 RepID=A0A9J5Z1F7_SOLCO|nr:hypothetical protein H5410_026410 [Solanum commersonii]
MEMDVLLVEMPPSSLPCPIILDQNSSMLLHRLNLFFYFINLEDDTLLALSEKYVNVGDFNSAKYLVHTQLLI